MTAHEQLVKWWQRVHEIAPWAWRSDPYLQGIDEDMFLYLRNLPEPPALDVDHDAASRADANGRAADRNREHLATTGSDEEQ